MSHRWSRAKPLALIAAPCFIFIAVWLFRWLSTGALENDHFVALARAHQMLYGDWPVRDFVDPGQPLAYLLSAGAARLFGSTLLTDVAVATTLLSLAGGLTYLLALRASGSVLIAVAAVAVEVAAAPRLYNAGKVLVPLAAVWVGWRYADAPSTRRLAALAAWTAIAFLWRHDFIIYVAIPAIGLFALCHERPYAIRRTLLYLTLTIAFLLPWMIYIQWADGLVDYFAAASRFATTEAQRTVSWPRQASAIAALVVALPVAAVLLARQAHERLSFAHVAFAASLALLASAALLRDVIAARLPDVVGLSAVLAAWIAGQTVPRPLLRIAPGITLLVVVAIVGARLASEGYGSPTPRSVARRFVAVSTMLKEGTADAVPNRERLALVRYIASCTPDSSRVLVSGFGPEIPVLARRPFAGGVPTWIPGYGTNPRDVERAAAQLAREPVSVAIMLEGSAAFIQEWPTLAADLRARHLVERTWRFGESDVVVWISEDLAARARSAPPSCEP
jgi:hypothetical protein